MKKLLSLFAILLSFNSFSQEKLDSLNQVWLDESKPDTIRLMAIKKLIWDGYLFTDTDTAFVLASDMNKFALEAGIKEGQAAAVNIQGICHDLRGNYERALKLFEQNLELNKQIANSKGESSSLNNIGLIHQKLGHIDKAISLYSQSLNIATDQKNLSSMANAQNNLANAYSDKGDLDIALEYYLKSLEICKELYDKYGIGVGYNNIGILYQELGDTVNALKSYRTSLNTCQEIQDLPGAVMALNNIASIHIYGNKLDSAQLLSEKALTLSKQVGFPQGISNASKRLYQVYKKQEHFTKALAMHELYMEMKDSIRNDDVKKQIAQAESRAEFKQELLIQEQQEKEAARIEAEKIERRNTIQYSGIGLGLFALFGLVFLFGRIQLPNWAVELSVFLPFLILFEFLLVITDPYVDVWSGGEPLVKLGLNVLMAGAIFPLHAFFEKTLKRRLFRTAE
jgi:tetratricopeptide (TPR) repeat protein